MTGDVDVGSLVAQLGVGAVSVYALYRVASSIGERLVAGIDRLVERVGEMSERLARLERTIESEILFRDRTPVETHPAAPRARSTAGEIDSAGRYSVHRGGRRDG